MSVVKRRSIERLALHDLKGSIALKFKQKAHVHY